MLPVVTTPRIQHLPFSHPPALDATEPPPLDENEALPDLGQVVEFENAEFQRATDSGVVGLRNFVQIHPAVDWILGSKIGKEVVAIAFGIYTAVQIFINGPLELRILTAVAIVLIVIVYGARAFESCAKMSENAIANFHNKKLLQYRACIQQIGFLDESISMADDCLTASNEVEPRLTNYNAFISSMQKRATDYPGSVDARLSAAWLAMKPHIVRVASDQGAAMRAEATSLRNKSIHAKRQQQRLAARTYRLASPYWSDRLIQLLSCCAPRQQAAPPHQPQDV